MEFNKTHAIYRVIHYKTVPETKRRNTFLASALLPFPKPFPLTAGTEVTRVCVCVCVCVCWGWRGQGLCVHVSLSGYSDYILHFSFPQICFIEFLV